MTPKEYKQMMDYLTRSGIKDQVKFASDLAKPVDKFEVQQIKLFNEFNRRNPRTGKAGGGRIGFAEGDRGKGEYKRDSLSKTEQKKIKDAFPNTKFDFDKYRYGVKKYPNIKNQNITNKDYTKVIRFIKKGYKLGKGEGLTTRGEKPKARGTKLSLQDQEKIKSLFELPPGEEWDFKTHKYGIKQEGRENLLARMARAVNDKKPWKVAADFGSTKGWMIAQMNRVFENETKAGVKPNKLTYQPVYKVINDRKRIIGFKDNTTAGGGKFYYGLEKYKKKNATDFVNHGDFKLNQKLVDISKRSLNQPNEVITGLLKDKGFTGKVNLNQLINFLSGTEATSAELLKNAVVRHHNSGVAFGSATNDLSLTTQIINKKIRNAEANIRQGNILQEDIQLLKNNNVFVRGKDGKLYGSGAKTPIGQFKQIEKSVETALQKGVDFKGKKFSDTQLKTFLQKIGCPGLASGGRAGFDVGTNCQIKGAELINSGMKNASSAQLKNFAAFANRAASLGRGVTKFGVIPEALFVAADSAIRMGMGDNLNEAFLRATDYLRPGDQTKLAEMLEADRFFGPEVAGIIGKSLDYKNELAKVQSLQDQKANLENLSERDEFDYIGDLSQDVKNIDAQLKQATDNLNNKFKMTDAEQIYADRMQEEVDDARSAGSLFTKLKSKFRDVGQDQSDIETLGMTEQTQEDLNKRMLPQAPTIYKIENGKLIEKNLSEATQTEIMDHVRLLKPYGVDISTKGLLEQRNYLRGMPLSEQEQLFGKEATYGASGTMGEPINKPVFKKPQNVIGDMEKEIVGQTNVANPFDIDISDIGTGLRGFAAAGGGIAKLAGVPSGPPPESGPNSQGLPGLLKRVKKL